MAYPIVTCKCRPTWSWCTSLTRQFPYHGTGRSLCRCLFKPYFCFFKSTAALVEQRQDEVALHLQGSSRIILYGQYILARVTDLCRSVATFARARDSWSFTGQCWGGCAACESALLFCFEGSKGSTRKKWRKSRTCQPQSAPTDVVDCFVPTLNGCKRNMRSTTTVTHDLNSRACKQTQAPQANGASRHQAANELKPIIVG